MLRYTRDKTLKVWDLERGKELQTLAGHSHGVNGVAVTPDGKRAVSASRSLSEISFLKLAFLPSLVLRESEFEPLPLLRLPGK